MLFPTLCTLALLSGAPNSVKDLIIGDPVPAFTVSTWLKGSPIRTLSKGKIYVVDFWATWCQPCMESYPLLTQLQTKWKDKVTVIGIDVWEPDPKAAPQFVKKLGHRMSYSLAADYVPSGSVTGDEAARAKRAHDLGAMSKDWLIASGIDKVGIPAAFIVNSDGKIAWIGDPHEIEEPLEKIVANRWTKEEFTKMHQDDLKEGQEQFDFYNKLSELQEKRSFTEAVQLIDSYVAQNPSRRVGALGSKFRILLLDQKRADEAYRCAETAMQITRSAAYTPLPQIANAIAFAPKEAGAPNLELALKVALRADSMAGGFRAGVKETLARIYFLMHDYRKAISAQKQAIDLNVATDKSKMLARLKEYETAQQQKA